MKRWVSYEIHADEWADKFRSHLKESGIKFTADLELNIVHFEMYVDKMELMEINNWLDDNRWR